MAKNEYYNKKNAYNYLNGGFPNITFDNKTNYNDKGDNNLWSQPEKFAINDDPDILISSIMRDRNKARLQNLDKLMSVGTNGTKLNLDFIDKFYQNLFKGTSYIKIIPPNVPITKKMRKKYKIYTRYIEDKDKIPRKETFIFMDKLNPCHLIKKIVKIHF